jgi:hypothetical protein
VIRCASHRLLAQKFDSIQVGTGVISHKLYSQRTRQPDPEIAPESHPTTLYTWPRNGRCCQNVGVERSSSSGFAASPRPTRLG